MNVHPLIALILGLVIQFSQVPSRVVGESMNPCAARPMTCCEGMKTCPCAKEGERKQQPAPLIPATADLKSLVAKTPGTDAMAAFIAAPPAAVLPKGAVAPARRAYAGVPLAVAFCSFVI